MIVRSNDNVSTFFLWYFKFFLAVGAFLDFFSPFCKHEFKGWCVVTELQLGHRNVDELQILQAHQCVAAVSCSTCLQSFLLAK